jgi:hypothetical protein
MSLRGFVVVPALCLSTIACVPEGTPTTAPQSPSAAAPATAKATAGERAQSGAPVAPAATAEQPRGASAAPAATAKPAASPAQATLTELEAAESTKLHQPIAAADAETLLSSIEQTTKAEAKPESIIGGGGIIFLEPDLTVVEDDRSQWHCDPSFGCYWAYARGFDVQNIGRGYAGTFHVAVLQGSDSYGFDVPGLAPGASQYFQITQPSYLGPACGVTAVIIVNPFNALPETNYNNNVASVAGLCLL